MAKRYLADNIPISDQNNSSIVLKFLNEVKTAFAKVYNLAAVVATSGSSTTVRECSFTSLTKVDAPTKFQHLNVTARAKLKMLLYRGSVRITRNCVSFKNFLVFDELCNFSWSFEAGFVER